MAISLTSIFLVYIIKINYNPTSAIALIPLGILSSIYNMQGTEVNKRTKLPPSWSFYYGREMDSEQANQLWGKPVWQRRQTFMAWPTNHSCTPPSCHLCSSFCLGSSLCFPFSFRIQLSPSL